MTFAMLRSVSLLMCGPFRLRGAAARSTRKVVAPSRKRSPRKSDAMRTGSPLTNTPLRLDRSCTFQTPSSNESRQCWRLISGANKAHFGVGVSADDCGWLIDLDDLVARFAAQAQRHERRRLPDGRFARQRRRIVAWAWDAEIRLRRGGGDGAWDASLRLKVREIRHESLDISKRGGDRKDGSGIWKIGRRGQIGEFDWRKRPRCRKSRALSAVCYVRIQSWFPFSVRLMNFLR